MTGRTLTATVHAVVFAFFVVRSRLGPISGLDPRPSVAAEQVQLLANRCDPDFLTDGRGLGSGDADDDLARGQLAGIGGNALLVLLAGTVNEGLGADALDRF